MSLPWRCIQDIYHVIQRYAYKLWYFIHAVQGTDNWSPRACQKRLKIPFWFTATVLSSKLSIIPSAGTGTPAIPSRTKSWSIAGSAIERSRYWTVVLHSLSNWWLRSIKLRARFLAVANGALFQSWCQHSQLAVITRVWEWIIEESFRKFYSEGGISKRGTVVSERCGRLHGFTSMKEAFSDRKRSLFWSGRDPWSEDQ